MDKKVTVLTPNGRRQVVKVTPNTTLLQILEEACQKHNFDSDGHSLRHHNKEIDLTQPFRFSGLPNNCLLEMHEMERKRSTAPVDICIQWEDGSRLQGQFPSSTDVWSVVENLNAPVLNGYESPVAIYMRQEIIGRENMKKTTLKSLGITEGRAMIRCINKNPEELKTQANVYIPPVVKEKPSNEDDEDSARRARANKGGGGGGFAITKDLVQSLKKSSETSITKQEEDADMDNVPSGSKNDTTANVEKPKYDWGTGAGQSIRSSAMELAAEQQAARDKEASEAAASIPEPEVHIIGERNALLYSLDETKKQIEDLPDSFFDLTVHDLKLVLRDLKKISTGNEDAPLLTTKLREIEENTTMLHKIAQYKNCVIRIQFPDRHVLQGMFKPIDKVRDVMEFVQKFLANPKEKFHLFTIPNKTVFELDKTLLEMDFVPTAVVHFAFDNEGTSSPSSYLKAEFTQKLTSTEGAFFAANKWRMRKISRSEDNNNEPSFEPGPSTGAIPKRPRN